jgi:hypothetical protein
MIMRKISRASGMATTKRSSYVLANDDTKTSEPWDIDPRASYQWIRLAAAAFDRQEVQLAEQLIEIAYWAADGIECSRQPPGSESVEEEFEIDAQKPAECN